MALKKLFFYWIWVKSDQFYLGKCRDEIVNYLTLNKPKLHFSWKWRINFKLVCNHCFWVEESMMKTRRVFITDWRYLGVWYPKNETVLQYISQLLTNDQRSKTKMSRSPSCRWDLVSFLPFYDQYKRLFHVIFFREFYWVISRGFTHFKRSKDRSNCA